MGSEPLSRHGRKILDLRRQATIEKDKKERDEKDSYRIGGRKIVVRRKGTEGFAPDLSGEDLDVV